MHGRFLLSGRFNGIPGLEPAGISFSQNLDLGIAEGKKLFG
jgi:hypothetical protein